ncbi:MAG: tubulin-like doman-containing protein [Planctomycetota bacterium]
MPETTNQPPQILPGYTLVDRLGAGGYGEVWRAHAPGGLDKAVKYVFGRQDEARASAEMKSLERIKGVRHPFLLSLERIEVVEGRLIVVTELADGSLRDRSRACLDAGQDGIPREELVGYLRDAADALDFLHTEHDLQHLDIKPENLLLLAGHVKVADFGLVKSISNHTQSLVGGMTPTYAAPEVFQGRPSKHSDQYSLAVMYQELLTGALPFAGANVAELTLQHMNQEPDLAALSEQDRYVISRALAKDPEYRFESCGAMVRALAEGLSGGDLPPAPRRSRPVTRAASPAHSATEVFAADDAGWSEAKAPILIEVPAVAEPAVVVAAPPEFEETDFDVSPCLFLGIGGAAGRVLRNLRKRMSDRFEGGPLPAMPMLLLDTDAQSLTAATRGAERGEGLTREETVSLPLRRPQEYRGKAPQLLAWLGRRWLYNIPRSQQTDGIRPLGRLALVDHARQTFQRIRRALSECVTEESVADSAALSGLPFQGQKVRVYVCASISGGAGGGMSLDVAYAVRSILERLDLDDARVTGVMMHSTSRDVRRGELACVNAYAWLSEYHHLCQADTAYPGDEGCGLPAHEAGVAPFDDTYLVDLGAGLDGISFEAAAGSVADYLYLDAITPTQPLLDRCRAAYAGDNDATTVRTFGVVRQDSAAPATVNIAAARAVDELLRAWLGGETGSPATGSNSPTSEETACSAERPDNPTTNPIVHGAAQLVAGLKLDAPGLASLCRSIIEAHLGEPPEAAVAAMPLYSGKGASSLAEALAPVHDLFAAPAESGEAAAGRGTTSVGFLAGRPIASLVEPLAAKIGEELRQWIVRRIDGARDRLPGAQRAAEWFRGHLEVVARDLTRLADASGEQGSAWLNRAQQDFATGVGASCLAESRGKRLRQLLDHAAIDGAAGIVRSLYAALALAEEENKRMASTLAALRPAESDMLPVGDADEEEAESRFAEICGELRERVEADLLVPGAPLSRCLADATRAEALGDKLGRLAEQVASHCLNGAASRGIGGESGCPLPPLAEVGATVTEFMMLPQALAEQETPRPGRVTGPDGASFWGVEAAGLSVPRLAAEVVSRRRDYATLGERVHTRKDIDWPDVLTSLIDTQAAAKAPPLAVDTPCTQPLSVPD